MYIQVRLGLLTIRKSSLPRGGGGGGGLIYFKHIWRGGLNRDGPGEREGLIQFTKDGGISSPKRTRTQSGKAQVKEFGGHVTQVQTSIR